MRKLVEMMQKEETEEAADGEQQYSEEKGEGRERRQEEKREMGRL